MIRQFGKKETERVAAAWKRLVARDKFRTTHGEHPLMRQKARFYIEGLRATPLWRPETAEFPWVQKLQAKWKEIRDLLIPFDAQDDFLWPTAECIGYHPAYGEKWEPLPMQDFDTREHRFPVLEEWLHDLKVPFRDVMYARLPHEATIKPHSDECNFVLTAHLGLDIPTGECFLNVGDQRLTWSNGKVSIFDSSFLHEAENTSGAPRTVLLLRVWHPDLSPVEVDALDYLFGRMAEQRGDGSVPLASDGYAFRLDGKYWKLPTPRLNMAIFPEQCVLRDVDDNCYVAGDEGRNVLIENGHDYQLIFLRPDGYNDTPAEILEEQTELQKWMKFLQPGDTFDADDPSELETSGGDDSFYSSGDESGPQPEWMDDPDDSRWEEDDSVREPTSSDEDRWPGEVSSGSDDTDDSD
jgi:hypothetical protein